MTKKSEEKTKKENNSPKKILYELVEESKIEEHKIMGALGKAGLIEQYVDEKIKFGRFDIEPTLTQAEFDKILKDFLG